MKKVLTRKILFIAFFIVMVIINLTIPNTMNYDNTILQQQYDIYGLDAVPASYAQVVDNESKVEDFDEFLNSIKLLIFAVSFMFALFFLIFDFNKLSITKIFLLVSVPIGLIYISLVPIGSPPDEPAHWYKAYEVSQGHFASDKNKDDYGGRKLPTILQNVVTDDYLKPSKPTTLTGVVKSYNEWMNDYEKAEENYDGEEEFIVFSNTAIYSAIVYLPQAIGIWIVKVFSGSYLAQAYGARVVNYLAFILIMSFALKKLPFKKVGMLVVAMLPIAYQEVTSMSIDGLQIAFSTLLISYTLYLTYDETKEKLNWKDYVILTVSCVFTAITKMLYLPLCLIIFIIPKDKFKNTKVKYIVLIAIFLVVTILDGLLMLNSTNYKNIYARPETRMMDQILYILKDPLAFLNVILLTIQKFGLQHVFGLFGQVMCWEDLDISSIYILSLFVVTMYFIYFKKPEEYEKNTNIKNIITKCFMFIIAFGTSFGIVLATYATLCPVGYSYILGIQGRYYIPMLLLYGVSLTKLPKKKEELKGIEYVLMFMIFANLDAITNILFRYL